MKIKSLIYIIAIVLLASCASSSNTTSSLDIIEPDKLSTTYPELADHLYRVPGLSVNRRSGTYTVLVRGISSITGPNEPLYVIDRVQVGSYEQSTSLIDSNDIAYVEVLKDVASSNVYGMRGANGVIIIHTKN